MSNRPPVSHREAGSLFRKSSLTQGQQRFLGEVVLAGPASTPVSVAIAGICLAAIIAMAFVIQVPARLNAPGVLLPIGGLTTIQSEQNGTVGQVLIEVGASVAAGQPLMTLLVDRPLADGAGSYDARIDSTGRQRNMLRERRERERIALDARLESMALRRSALQSTLASLAERENNAARQMELAASGHRRLANLSAGGHAAMREVEPAELRLLQAKAALNELRSEQMEAETAIARIAREMDSETASFEALDLNLAIESEKLAGQLVELDGMARRAIIAPMDGSIADVLVSAGDTVSTGAALASLQRPDSPMEARLYLSPALAGRAEAGQEAVLKLPTFPSRQFGVIRGRLVEMTAAPIDPRAARFVSGLLTPVYEARVALDRQYMDAMGRRWSLRPGLSVEATIIETRRTLMSWLLQPLIRGSGSPGTDAEEKEFANVEAGI